MALQDQIVLSKAMYTSILYDIPKEILNNLSVNISSLSEALIKIFFVVPY